MKGCNVFFSAAEDPEEIASARLYTGLSVSRLRRDRLRNDGGGRPICPVLCNDGRGDPFAAAPVRLRKTKRLRVVFVRNAVVVSSSAGTAMLITSAAM